MNTLRLHSHTRRQRSVMLLPAMDQWIEREAARLGVSFSEAMNRLLTSYWQFHQEVNTDGGADDHGVAEFTPVLLAHLKEPLLAQMQAVREEVEKVKSNLYLLQTMQDRTTAKMLTDRQYDAWREEVKGVMDKRKRGKA
jgi:hypothetical protein